MSKMVAGLKAEKGLVRADSMRLLAQFPVRGPIGRQPQPLLPGASLCCLENVSHICMMYIWNWVKCLWLELK